MKIAILDDDADVLTELANILRLLQYEVIAYRSPYEMLSMQYPVYFLDIGMEEMNGIEVGEQLRKKYPSSIIIYLTNFDDYRSQAFGVHAFDYIKKPVTKERIQKVMADMKKIHHELQPQLLFKTKDGMLRIQPSDILYFEFYNRKVLLHMQDHVYTTTQNLKDIVRTMTPWEFVMPHKSFCVNLQHVRLLKGYDITMTNGDQLPLSQKRSMLFRKALNEALCKMVSDGDTYV